MEDRQESTKTAEISITDVVLKLWTHRGVLLIIPFLSLLVGISFALLQKHDENKFIRYYVELNGIENGLYPDETPFNVTNLVSNEVLAAINAGLSEGSPTLKRRHIKVEALSPASSGIEKKYTNALRKKGLTAPQIDKLNKDFKAELQAINQKSALVTINFEAAGYNEDTAIEIVTQVPETWSRIFSEKYSANFPSSLSKISLPHSADDNIDVVYLTWPNGVLTQLHNSLMKMKDDPRLGNLKAGGEIDISSLLIRLEFFTTNRVNFFQKNLIAVSDTYRALLESEMMEEKKFLKASKISMDRNIETLVQVLNNEAVLNKLNSNEAALTEKQTLSVDPDLAFRERSDLVEEYLVEALKERHLIEIARSRKEDAIERLAAPSEATSEEAIAEMSEEIIREVSYLIEKHNEVIDEFNKRYVSEEIKLYTPYMVPKIEGKISLEKSIMSIGLFISFGLFLGCISALLLPSRKQKLRN